MISTQMDDNNLEFIWMNTIKTNYLFLLDLMYFLHFFNVV